MTSYLPGIKRLFWPVLVAVVFLTFLTGEAGAAVCPAGTICICTTDADVNDNGLRCLEGTFKNILGAVVALAGIFCFLYIIKGGIQYTTAGGDSKAIDSARRTITWAAFGLLFAVIAYALVNVIGQTFDINNLLRFVIPG